VDSRTLQAFKDLTAEKLREVRCPDHQQPPRVKFSGGSLREVTVSLSGCCEKLLALANRAISEPSAKEPTVLH
jgi:hypothetical protein